MGSVKIEYTLTISTHWQGGGEGGSGWKANFPCRQNASETSPVSYAHPAAQTCTAGEEQCGVG